MSHPDGNNTSCNFLLADNLINPGLMEIRDTRPGRNVALFPFFFFLITREPVSQCRHFVEEQRNTFSRKSIGNDHRDWKIFPCLMKFDSRNPRKEKKTNEMELSRTFLHRIIAEKMFRSIEKRYISSGTVLR